jgi:hypothetical protein
MSTKRYGFIANFVPRNINQDTSDSLAYGEQGYSDASPLVSLSRTKRKTEIPIKSTLINQCQTNKMN